MLITLLLCLGQTPAPLKNANGPFEPAEAVKHLFVPPGFKVTPVAHEPAIVDPVCMCFDAKGRLFVCEMPGYPNGGRALGEETRGKIKMLEDKDGDGFFETVTLFADGLRFPTGITPYKDGMIVCNAPDIIYLKDTNGDGKADVKEIWYTGFDLTNIQQLPNSLQWGLDNRIWGMVAGTGGMITCPKKPEIKAVNLRNKGFRFDPAILGSFEATSGGGQYGLCRDAAGTWFTCTNGNCVRQIVIPEELATRNPDYIPPAVTADIDVEGTAINVFRKSPFEAWRVERTTRRREGDDNRKFIPTELVPGGYTSSTCGCIIYDADLFPKNYYGSFFGCDPGNNLIFRRVLSPNGSIYKSSRPPEEKDREFLASDDNWFRPVWMTLGPDGCIYVCDFYREVIETPLSIPDDMKKRLNVESRQRGRIWRIAPSDIQFSKSLTIDVDPENLARLQVFSENQSLRTIASRLTIEQGKHSLPFPNGKKSIGTELISAYLIPFSDKVADAAESEKKTIEFAIEFMKLYPHDTWIDSIILLSIKRKALVKMLDNKAGLVSQSFILSSTNIVGHSNNNSDIAQIIDGVSNNRIPSIALSGLSQGMQSKGKSLSKLLADPPEELKTAVAKLKEKFRDASMKTDEASLRLLAFAPFDLAKPALEKAFTNESLDSANRIEAVRSLGKQSDASVTGILIGKWPSLPLTVKREIQDVLLSKPDRTQALLAAIEKGTIKPYELDTAKSQQLRNHPNAAIRAKANAILAASIPAERKKVLEEYVAVVDLKGDFAKGKTVFQTQCAMCHKFDGVGHEVGPNLLTTVLGKSVRDLTTAILDPNREVDTRYLSYTAALNDGRVFTGIIISETANGLTLRQADGKDETILRSNLESLKTSGQSLMPEGLEKQIPPQAMADLIAYLREQK